MAATCGLVCHKTSAQLMEQLQAHTQTLSQHQAIAPLDIQALLPLRA